MKKYFALAAIAVLALASCSHNTLDPQSQKNREINFSTVAGKATKAPITSTYFLSTNANFGVYAYYLQEGQTWASNYASGTLYMGTLGASGQNAAEGVEVEYDGHIWAPTNVYYWPLQGSLTFFAYWPYDAIANPAYAVATKTFTTGTFTVATSVADQIDVLVSGFTENQTNNTIQYSDNVVNSGDTLGVPIVFNHMLSQVVFTAAASSAVYSRGLSFKIDSIGVGARGTSTGLTVIPGGTPSWAEPTALTGYTVINEQFPNSTVTPVNADNWLTDSQSTQIGDALLMIPTPDFLGVDNTDNNKAASSNDDEYVTVKYTLYRMSDGLNMGTKRVTFWLNDNTTQVSSWEPGKKYTYQLTIDLEQIYFAPTVTPWVDATPQPVAIP